MLKKLKGIILAALLLMLPAHAGALSVLESTSVQLTNYSADSETNIDLTFTAVANNDDANGSLEVVFNDFDLTGLGEDDVDLLVNAAQQDIEGCVTIDADSITIDDWTCVGLDHSDGDVFRLLVGTNTSNESVGNNRITTPDYATGGQYMSIVATLVDSVSGNARSYFSVPVYTGSSGSIGATVDGGGTTPPSGCSGSCPEPEDPVYAINLLSPLAGDEYLQGEQINITWETTEDPISYVTLYYQADVSGDDYVGTDYFEIATNVPNTGSYNWTVPSEAFDTDEAYIYLFGTDLASDLASDSEGPFTVGEPIQDAITVTSPNGGESYEVGETIRIRWTERGGESMDSIELSRDSGGSWEELTDFVENFSLGSTFEDWIATGPATDEALIRVNGQVLNDVSDAVFSITEPSGDVITVISPNGGETFVSGDDITLNWSVEGDVSLVDLFVWDGSQWLQAADDIDADLGTYVWTSGADISTEEALFRAVSFDDALIVDESDAVFSILPEEEIELSVQVVYPNGGEVFSPGETVLIQVNSAGEYDAIDLFVTFNGVSYSPILTNAPAGSSQFSWQVPEISTDTGFVRVDLITNGEVVATDTSDGPFSIFIEDLPPPPPEPPEPPEPPTPPTVDSDQIDGSIQFILFDGGLVLPDQGGRSYEALTGVTLIVRAVDAEGAATSAEISLNGRVLQMNNLGNGVFELPIVASDITGAVTFLAEEDREVLNYDLDALPYGLVSDSRTGEPVFSAISFVLSQVGTQVNVAPYGFSNPRVTSADGLIGWMLPNGVYEVTVAKEGYRSDSRVVSINNLVLNPRFVIESLEELPPEPPVDQDDPEEPIDGGENDENVVTKAVRETAAAVSKAVGNQVKALRESPSANVVADISEPAIVVSSVASAAVLASSFGALSYLQYLFTAPLLFFARRKRNATGIVYHAITKVPIGLAVIRVFTEDGKLIKSLVSDPKGHFSIKLAKGRYSIQVIKEGFIFPSEYLKDRKSDASYVDLYTGGLIEVEKDDAVLSINIPLDPNSVSNADLRKLYLRRFFRIFQTIAAHVGIVVAVFVVIVQPSTLSYVLLALQILLYIGTRILIAPHGSRGWGLVVDAKTGKPIRQAVVRLFEPKFNKLIETQITDRKGRYSMTAGPNAYYLTSQKEGYEQGKVDNIDYSNKTEPDVIAVDISLEPKGDDEV